MIEKVRHWNPFAFCAFISFIVLFTPLFAPVRLDAGWWRPVFFAFLPMCFFFVGSATSQMQREIRDLRKQVLQLRGHPPA